MDYSSLTMPTGTMVMTTFSAGRRRGAAAAARCGDETMTLAAGTCGAASATDGARRSDDRPGRDRNGGWHQTWSDGRVRRREKQNFAHRNWREKRSALKGAGEGGLSGLSTESEADRKSSSASGDVGEWFHN